MRLRRARRGWRVYSSRQADGSYRMEAIGGGAERKLPKDALVSADGNWAEVYDQRGLTTVLVASEPATPVEKRAREAKA